MAAGQVMATGSADDIMQNEQVIEAYLGTGIKNKEATEGLTKDAIPAQESTT
jgi:branched-chain amino acid transport system ATP-binding protein